MSGLALVVRANARRSWRGLLVLTLLVAVAGAAALAAAAGARRTASSFDRFERESRSADVEIDYASAPAAKLAELRRDPAVAGVGLLRMFVFVDPKTGATAFGVAPRDRSFGRDVDRPRLVHGRLADQSRVDELAIGESVAAQTGWKIGDTVSFASFSPAQIQAQIDNQGTGAPAGAAVELHVVGITRRPLDLGTKGGGASRALFLTRAFEQRYRDEIGGYVPAMLRVRATDGAAGVPDAVHAAKRILGEPFQVVGNEAETAGASDAVRVLSAALWIFAAVAAVAGLTAIGIVVLRQVDDGARDQRVLSALGLTTRQRGVAAASLAVGPALVGGALAVALAFAVSPLMPFGLAAQAEPDPGFDLDLLVSGLGWVAIVVFVLGVAALGGWRVARAATRREVHRSSRTSFASWVAARARTTPTASAGMRLAFEPGAGPVAVPVRTAILGATLGTIGIVAVLVFGASVDHLVTTPRQYGWAWDASVVSDQPIDTSQSGLCGKVVVPQAVQARFAALTGVCREGIEVAGHPATGWGFVAIRGDIRPVVVSGRAPVTRDEVALGGRLLDRTGRRVGETVSVQGDRGQRRYRIVGQVVLPSLEDTDTEPLASGAAFTGRGLARVTGLPDTPNANVLADFRPGDAPDLVRRQGLTAWRLGDLDGLGTVYGLRPIRPVEVGRIDQVGRLPLLLAALLALLAVIAVGHAVLLAVGRRRRELAVLRTMGFTRRDVRMTIGYQATFLTVVALVVGIPLGLVVGRAVWAAVADGLGVAPDVAIPVLGLIGIAVGSLVVGNVVGLLASRRAVRARPSVVLAEE